MNRSPTRDSPLFVRLQKRRTRPSSRCRARSFRGRARAFDRLRLDRAGREGASFSRYDLMVFMAFDVLKINVQGSLLINEGQKVKSRVAVLAYDLASLIRIGGIIEALNNLFAVRAQTLNRLKHGVSALTLRASIVVNFLGGEVGVGKEVFVVGSSKI